MTTYALFEDQSVSPLVCAFFAADPRDDPVRLAFPDIEDVQVRNSARNGCLAAYHCLSALGHIRGDERFFLSCQFAQGQVSLNAHGSSAGLAFCLQFSREVHNLGAAQPLVGAVAATGAVSDGTREAKVEGVKGIDAKLRAALDRLEEGGRIFYPQANDAEVELALRKEAARRNIRLIPVSTVEQALRELLPLSRRQRPAWPRRWAAWAGLGGLGLVAGFLLLLKDTDSLLVQAGRAQAEGQYLEAQALLQQVQAADPRAQALVRALTDTLKLELTFHYRSAGRQVSLPIAAGPAHLVLSSGDAYRISCTTGDSCHLYAYQFDAGGKLDLLAGPLLLKPGVPAYLPAAVEQWFQLDDRRGEEIVFFAASRTRAEDLEEVYARFFNSPAPEKEELRRLLLERLHRREQARQGGLMGIYYGIFRFQHH